MLKVSPWIKENFGLLRAKCNEVGREIRLIEGIRTPEVQAAYFAQGRQSLPDVNKLRKLAGLIPIDEKTNRLIITGTLNSKHIFGLAFDIVLMVDGKPNWSDKYVYKVIANIGEDIGLTAGHYFNRVDSCHFEKRD